MKLARLAETSIAVAATRSRSDKVALLAELVGEANPDEVAVIVGFMVGAARQGRIGIGWSTVANLDSTSTESSNTDHSDLLVEEIDTMLDEIAATTGNGSVERRREILSGVLRRATPEELGFLRQILVGELRQGALTGVVTDAVATAAGVPRSLMRRAVMLRGDLAEAAAIAMTEGREGLEAIRLEVGRAIEPMLASTATDVADALSATGLASVEWKLDGARIQVHRNGDDVRVFTRNLNDVTDRLSAVVDLTRALAPKRLVLDGEVVGFTEKGTPQAFQDTMSTFGTNDVPVSERVLQPFFFDIMLVDEHQLLDEPLSVRRRALLEAVGPHHIPSIETDNADEATRHLMAALAAGHEGVMVKALDSSYEAGRRGKSWRKVKPVHSFDLVVLAAEWGHGRRSGWLSNLHLGARNDSADGPDFIMVGKTFKGMTDDLLRWQTEELQARATRFSSTGHTVYVRPELVVEIAVDGVQTSRRYSGGVALRFARVRGYRPDRSPSNADSITAVRSLLPSERAT